MTSSCEYTECYCRRAINITAMTTQEAYFNERFEVVAMWTPGATSKARKLQAYCKMLIVSRHIEPNLPVQAPFRSNVAQRFSTTVGGGLEAPAHQLRLISLESTLRIICFRMGRQLAYQLLLFEHLPNHLHLGRNGKDAKEGSGP